MAHGTGREDPMRKLTLFALLAAAAAVLLKRQRDREFDESIWEEPREV